MTEITTTGRDEATGRFLPGNSGNGGRKPGSRSKLGEQFLLDLRDAWNQHGVEALRRCAVEEPAQFVRVIANLLPRDINIDLTATVDAGTFAEQFRNAVALLHDQQMPKAIEHTDASRHRR